MPLGVDVLSLDILAAVAVAVAVAEEEVSIFETLLPVVQSDLPLRYFSLKLRFNSDLDGRSV